VDVVSALLGEVRSEGAAVGHQSWAPPWRIHVAAKIPLAAIVITHGDAWIIPENTPAQHLCAGDAALLSNQHPYWIADSLNTDVRPHLTALAAGPGGHLALVDDESGRPPAHSSIVDDPRKTTLLMGNYQVRGRISVRLLDALPELLVVTGSERLRPVLALMSAEAERDEPGQQVVLDRLLDLLLFECLREWFSRADADQPGWIRALSDPILGPALRRMYAQPDRFWSVTDLAIAVGVSRATFSRRFTEMVGESPMKYLTNWRLTLAKDLLIRTNETVDSIARQVGYGTAYSLSAALVREYGVRPSSLRAAADSR
jgi:AraC-like DNA-binding protein